MAGIYIHIPFCGHACTYCDFYFTTHLQFKEKFLNTICHEIELRNGFLDDDEISTIYFGGGTPSQLSAKEIERILNEIKKNFRVTKNVEITLECNPDDINLNSAKALYSIGVNRLSMGIQSFHDNELKLLGRQHTGKEALDAVDAIQKAGFSNFNLDLIYGIPNSDLISWKKNLETIIKLQPNHISSYCLTIEPGTQLDYQVKKKRVVLPSENVVINQFEALMDNLEASKYDHYEISNFALKGFESKHNTSYWQGTSYLGLGPSAHSFNGINRKINIANTNKYCDLLKDDKGFEWEYLSETNRFNEYLMTGLRTKWGIDLEFIQENFPDSFILQLKIDLENPIKNSLLLLNNSNVVLTQKGKLFADKIASDLFRVS